MQKKVEKVFIGKNVSRTSGTITLFTAVNAPAAGEILVLDKNKNIMTGTETYSDTDKIYIVEGLSDTYSYVNPSGTNVTGVRKLMYSDPIDGSAVVTYSGKSYAAATESTFTLTGSLTPVVGTEYVIRIVYKDVEEHPGQFTYTYRVVSTSTSLTTLYTQFVTEINSHTSRRVTASSTSGPDVLTITALAYDDNEEVTSINEYKQNNPKIFLFSDNFGSVVVTQTVQPTSGSGTWRLVRDEEKWSQGYEGLLNRTAFPTQVPTFRTVKDSTYDCITIRHKNWYTASTNREEQVDITTKLYLYVDAAQNANILSVLNTWMGSLPNALPNVSV